MKNVIMMGATGMIGSLVLRRCLKDSRIEKLTSIVRKPSGIRHEKLTEIVHEDFKDFTSIAHYFEGQDICFYCLGVYTGRVSTTLFKEITVDFTEAFATMLRRKNQYCSFCFLSGAGADTTETSKLLFAKQKGIAENTLLKLMFAHLYIFRPGYIYPVTQRKEPNLMYQAMRKLYKTISLFYPNVGVSSEQLANKMFDTALSGSSIVVFGNEMIRAN